MLSIIRSSFIRVLLIAAFAGVCFFSQTKTGSAQTINIASDFRLSYGTFAAELICVENRLTCKNEKVVYVFEPIGRDAREILVTSEFIQGEVRVPFFKQKLQYNRSTKYFTGRFLTSRDWVNEGTRAGTTFTYEITVVARDSNILEGTISLTDSNTVVRRIHLKRVIPNQTPPAQSNILQQVRSGSRFALDFENSGSIDVITSAGPGALGGHVKAFSAGTLQMLRPAESLIITHTTSEVSVKFDNSAPLKSPTNGQPASWTRSDGAKYKLTSWLKNGSLVQVLSSSEETVTRTFTVSGTRLKVRVEAGGKLYGVWEYQVVSTGEI